MIICDVFIELADRGYHQNVTVMESIRDEWLTEHVTACEVRLLVGSQRLECKKKKEKKTHAANRQTPSAAFSPQMFEKQATERIVFLRNAVWTHLNQLSQQCVTSDEVKPTGAATLRLLPAAFKLHGRYSRARCLFVC